MAHCWQPQASFAGTHWGQANEPCFPSSTFRDLMYAFPKSRNTGRIMKPRSAGNSPSAGRRRAGGHHSSPVYQQQLPIHEYQVPFNTALLASAIRKKRTARPISWHPAMLASAEYSSPSQCIPTSIAPDSLGAMTMNVQPLNTTMTPHGDVTMMSQYASSGVPASTDDFTFGMTEPMSMHPSSYMQMNGSQVDPVSWDAEASNVPPLAQPMHDTWAFDMMAMHNSIPSTDPTGSSYASVPSSGCLSGPSTPDFLPIQQPEGNSKFFSGSISDEQEPGDELIGMGLYDHPEPALDSSSHGRCGKGLKLEETFTPSANDEADDTKDAESEDDNMPSSEPVNINSFPQDSKVDYMQSKPSAKPAGNVVQRSFFFDEEDSGQQAMGGYQQFFNVGTQPCLSYGYGWL